ncbi:AlkA N-terminal domain-containing protein [Alteromonas sp. 1_MG-2023]|uniref:Ada metal-binding domain-containing protein n=1 Tax=Alteromonas sp. 1_MG-2023 TaxID=3062669 RepID=UPI0026E3F015|nr:Ada metal-binding domain-containing protein [Alteromonas sp. 1_MG-2023]MDO6566941.1 AlkA N-terminal domain-containing protein [Alteromonas sp. 1_MG-2023]
MNTDKPASDHSNDAHPHDDSIIEHPFVEHPFVEHPPVGDAVEGEAVTGKHHHAYAKARVSRDARFDGRFFVAVKTTGIFCRPICPAKLPAEKNVAYYNHAAQAMNDGFRPCLRCRPDSAPSSFAWLGVGTTVARALTLLSDIPVQSISTISDRLGISERYLNKLMVSHTGLSPKQYQDLQRVLFAKQLLQQSTLPLIDIAFSAGYASIRQLQRAVQTYCKKTPSELRSKRNVSLPEISLRLYFRPPYHWGQVREFLALRAIGGVETITEDTYSRYICVGGESGFISATFNERANGFDVKIRLPNLAYVYKTVEQIKQLLDLHAAPELIEKSLQAAGLADSLLTKGLRLPGTWTVFESGCRAIVGQQVSVKAAINQAGLLAQHLGATATVEQADFEGGKHYCFPEPEAVASSDLAFLRMPNARKNALRDFAELFKNGNLPSHDEILSIKGVGQWTLDYLKMRGERDPDVYLAGDLIVRKMAGKHPVSPQEAAPWQSYLTLQLWQLSNN